MLFLDGSQTQVDIIEESVVFEGRVVLDGSQTHPAPGNDFIWFESRVVLDESQTGRAQSPAVFYV